MDSDREPPEGAPCPDCGRTLWSSSAYGGAKDYICYLCDLPFNS